jgi:ribosome-associated translation inhibitor RaiA
MGAVMMEDIQILVRSRDDMSPRLCDYAREKVAAALRRTSEPVLYARVWIDRAPDPAVARPAEAGVEVDLNGTVLRARADAATQVEAIDLMQDRLRARMRRQ